MDERQVKVAVLNHVRSAIGRLPKPLVAPELTLGTSGVRADLALLGDEFIGIEIKTERDTLRRLPSQMAAYSRYFQRSIAVISENHLRNVNISDLAGAALWTIAADGACVEIAPGSVHVPGVEQALDLMTQAERRGLVGMHELELDVPFAVWAHYTTVFRMRYGTTSASFWDNVRRRKISVLDLEKLSRFSSMRTAARQLADQKAARWNEWLEAQGCLLSA